MHTVLRGWGCRFELRHFFFSKGLHLSFYASVADYGHKLYLWTKLAILRPRWQCRKGKKVQTHRLGCTLPWSNLDPPWSSNLGSPGPAMARKGIFGHKWCQKWHFLAINTTQNVEKVWALVGSPFSTIRLTRKMQKLCQNRNFFWPPPL